MTRVKLGKPNLPRPPGFWIKQELDARGWGQRDLAYILGCHEQAVTLIISGKRGISPDMAKALGAAFDVSPEFFLNLQKSYDLALARDPDPGISLRARLQSSYPIREMIRRGWLVDADAANLELQMARFFEVSKLEDIPHLPHAGKKPRYDEIPPPQLAWLFRVRQIARSITVAGYSSKKLKALRCPSSVNSSPIPKMSGTWFESWLNVGFALCSLSLCRKGRSTERASG
jgi:HTH-type transcriptional regulator / antitoxin HigA